MIRDIDRQISDKHASVPVARLQAILSGKYKQAILWDFRTAPRRFGQIRKKLLRGTTRVEKVAPRVLSRELKTLTRFGLIRRKAYDVVPPKVEYKLTSLGRSLLPVISAMHKWGVRHLLRAVPTIKTEPVPPPTTSPELGLRTNLEWSAD